MKKKYICNEEIQNETLRLVLDGVSELISKNDALKMAQAQELDLVIVNNHESPPIAKIFNLEKFLYEQKKEEILLKKKNIKQSITKQIKLRVDTGKHDIDTKMIQARDFLEKKFKVLFSITLRKKREKGRMDECEKILTNIGEQLKNIGKVESIKVTSEDREIQMLIV